MALNPFDSFSVRPLMRFFNTVGPVDCEFHYCLPPLERIDLNYVLGLLEQRKYFILHAPRQTGKTSLLLALQAYLNRGDRFRCLYVNFEVAQAAREQVASAMRALLEEIGQRARLALNDPFPLSAWPDIFDRSGEHGALNSLLTEWCLRSPRPLVLLVDEIDSLIGDTLIAVLRQLRAGYDKRPHAFPSSIVLCGVRDVRDYRIHSSRTQEIITGGSAFNIKADSLRLGDLSQPEVERLLRQHTEETGQPFTEEALAAVWYLTQGQPWLVNALAYETCFRMPEGRDRSRPITADMVYAAKDELIRRRETHLDQLADKLREARVRRVIEPMLEGTELDRHVSDNDLQYVLDLGLIRRTESGLQIANPIYREVIPRELTYITQLNLESQQQTAWYIRADGRLDLPKLLAAFQQFFREHADSWLERFQYREAGPQLLLQAFLQRVVNSGGRVEREYGLGRRRTDLLILWPVKTGDATVVQRAVIELKLLHKSLEATLAEGLAQTWEYADRCGAEEAHLVIFDRRPGIPWEEKIFCRQETYRHRPITVWGM